MKLLVIGTVLVLYAVFLTPCFIEPTDIVVSTGYITIANEMGVDSVFIWLWIMSGYVALIIGILFGIGGSVIHFKNPIPVIIIVTIFAGIISYWFLFVSGIVSS